MHIDGRGAGRGRVARQKDGWPSFCLCPWAQRTECKKAVKHSCRETEGEWTRKTEGKGADT
jgi:hypothetical protein